MSADIDCDEEVFDPLEFDIRREGQVWQGEGKLDPNVGAKFVELAAVNRSKDNQENE